MLVSIAIAFICSKPHGICTVEEIKILLLNTHHLLNSFRLHQAREEVIAHVQAQLDEKMQLLNELDVACKEASWEPPSTDQAPTLDPEAQSETQAMDDEPTAPCNGRANKLSKGNLESILKIMDELSELP